LHKRLDVPSIPLVKYRDAARYYEAYRDRYPAELFVWLEEVLGERARGRVLDLAAGTGFLSRRFAALGARMVAMDEDLGMMAEGRRAGAGPVRWVRARSPRLPLRPGSFDAALIGNAVHWLATELPAADLAALLRPGGCLGMVTRSHPLAGPEPWKEPVREVLAELLPGSLSRFAAQVEPNLGRHEAYLTPPFSLLADRHLNAVFSLPVRDYAGFLLSTSWFESVRSDELLAELHRRIDPVVRPYLEDGEVRETVRYRGTVARVAERDG
jgi:SAM-dependent methyltransferase